MDLWRHIFKVFPWMNRIEWDREARRQPFDRVRWTLEINLWKTDGLECSTLWQANFRVESRRLLASFVSWPARFGCAHSRADSWSASICARQLRCLVKRGALSLWAVYWPIDFLQWKYLVANLMREKYQLNFSSRGFDWSEWLRDDRATCSWTF